jgi:hypothetical protein
MSISFEPCDHLGCPDLPEFRVLADTCSSCRVSCPSGPVCRRHLEGEAADPWHVEGITERAKAAVEKWRREIRERNQRWTPIGGGSASSVTA